jgi:hypothetical protein
MSSEKLIAAAVLVPPVVGVVAYNVWALYLSGRRRLSALRDRTRTDDPPDGDVRFVRCDRVDCRGELCDNACC